MSDKPRKPDEELKLNNWDKLIGYFSASQGFKRARYRAAANLVRKYEGSSKGRRGGNWRANSSSANAEIETSLVIMRNRARQLVRDNSYASKGIQVITSNVIGHGIFTQIKVDPAQARGTGTNDLAAKREIDLSRRWKAWANTKQIDYDGRSKFAGIQRIVMREVVESGEVLIRRRRTGRRTELIDGVQVEIPPIQLQVLEADFLDLNGISSGRAADGNRIIQGIEIDSNGKRVAYHLFKEHPGNAATGLGFSLASSFETVRIPAEDILHIYRIDRAGQHRGMTWFAPTMFRLKDFDEYEDAQLIRQKIAACFAVFVRDIEGFNESPTPAEGELGEKIEPGIIETLAPGKDITFANPPGVEGYREYTSTQLHAIAAGLGITYESLTGDLSEVSFSSARMGFLEMNRNISEWRTDIIIPQLNEPVFSWWVNGVDMMGVDTARVRAVFAPPRREMVDPVKETAATKDAVRSGLMSLPEALRFAGKDPEQHFEEIKKTNEKLDEMKIVLDTDPRKDADRIKAEQPPAPPLNSPSDN